jgi:hypothetical protein
MEKDSEHKESSIPQFWFGLSNEFAIVADLLNRAVCPGRAGVCDGGLPHRRTQQHSMLVARGADRYASFLARWTLTNPVILTCGHHRPEPFPDFRHRESHDENDIPHLLCCHARVAGISHCR